jgi:hypothetical protein
MLRVEGYRLGGLIGCTGRFDGFRAVMRQDQKQHYQTQTMGTPNCRTPSQSDRSETPRETARLKQVQEDSFPHCTTMLRLAVPVG